jgi:hypothetical protein
VNMLINWKTFVAMKTMPYFRENGEFFDQLNSSYV